jgi:hypothetical protein
MATKLSAIHRRDRNEGKQIMNTKIVRSPGRITNRRESEREIKSTKVKKTSRTMLRRDVGREDEEIL